MGLHRAGFDVVGVDIEPQPRYPFTFIQADALSPPVRPEDFDFIWASPPCQHATTLRHLQAKEYPALIPATRALLRAAGVPYVIENVAGAKLNDPLMLCGTDFGLNVWRHRYFEKPFLIPRCQCRHGKFPQPIDVTGTGARRTNAVRGAGGGNSRKPRNLEEARSALGIDWMSRKELSQAIPPAYAEYIGRAAIRHIEAQRKAA